MSKEKRTYHQLFTMGLLSAEKSTIFYPLKKEAYQSEIQDVINSTFPNGTPIIRSKNNVKTIINKVINNYLNTNQELLVPICVGLNLNQKAFDDYCRLVKCQDLNIFYKTNKIRPYEYIVDLPSNSNNLEFHRYIDKELTHDIADYGLKMATHAIEKRYERISDKELSYRYENDIGAGKGIVYGIAQVKIDGTTSLSFKNITNTISFLHENSLAIHPVSKIWFNHQAVGYYMKSCVDTAIKQQSNGRTSYLPVCHAAVLPIEKINQLKKNSFEQTTKDVLSLSHPFIDLEFTPKSKATKKLFLDNIDRELSLKVTENGISGKLYRNPLNKEKKIGFKFDFLS